MEHESYLDVIKNYGQPPRQSTFASYMETTFNVLSNLGSGGFGSVFEVKHRNTERSYAIKRVKIERNKGVDYAIREMLVLKALNHPNIVRYFDSWLERTPSDFCYDHYYYYNCNKSSCNLTKAVASRCNCCPVNPHSNDMKIFFFIQMELCLTGSLKDWLFFTAPNRVKADSLDVFRQIVDGVAYIHSKNLIHRDLKPCNIFFSLNGVVKIGDFGLVTSMDNHGNNEELDNSIEQSHTRGAGTQLYMSPEVYYTKTYDNKADIFALGMILYELMVPYSNEEDRTRGLIDLRRAIYNVVFVLNDIHEFHSVVNMMCINPDDRPTIFEVREMFS
ncbi:interferon-induced, double-stranded RNA-activated protein kinase-like [Onthophagus taurus]|uniref:interferon-induced, double-stranded RNA-activated protein kinase-like n=1 Tax=Onthophagus taurus TaxID=166361 RepID=UPI000C20A5BD|nr:eukaryotic translation initiation factor 2-alpha kinase 3-like [Onthophagus taurus]